MSGRVLVPQDGIEPPHSRYKGEPLPLRIQGQKSFGLRRRNRTFASCPQNTNATITPHGDNHIEAYTTTLDPARRHGCIHFNMASKGDQNEPEFP